METRKNPGCRHTKDRTTHNEHSYVLSSSLQDDTNDSNGRTDEDGRSSTELVGTVSRNSQTEDPTNVD